MSGHKAKAAPEEEHGESAPLWIISFCDLALCMLSFFVILSAGAAKNIQYDPEFAELVAAIKKAFKFVPSAPSETKSDANKDLKDILGALKNRKGQSGNSGKSGEATLRTPGVSGKHDLVTTVRSGKQTTIGGTIGFAENQTKLSDGAIGAIRQIAEQIRGHMNVFAVKGHSSREEEYQLKDSKRDLAYERAVAVMNKLVEFGVSRESLRVVSCRAFEPLKEDAYSEINKGANRRVEVLATEALVSEYKGEKKNSAAANNLVHISNKLDQKIKENEEKSSNREKNPSH